MNCASNIITANFSGGKTHATTARVYQWSRGIELCITGADNLPQTFKAHFSVQKRGGVATTIVGIDERVDVPNVLFTIGKDIHVWLGASETEDDAEILYTVDIPVAPAPMPEYYDAEDTGVFDAVVEKVANYAATATAAANNAGASATAAAGSASAAAASASSAAGSAGAAEQARADAVTAKGQAETAAQTATEKAQQTAQDAAQAAQSKTDAESAAGRAEAAQTAAEAAKTAAAGSANAAAASATAAGNAASGAGQAAGAAGQYATSAGQSASRAETAASTAEGKASDATFAAGQAVEAETEAISAKNAAQVAESNATNAATTAAAKATEAAASATAAAQAAASINTPDSALSDTSTNAVQNKVITAELTDVKTAIHSVANVKTGVTGSANTWETVPYTITATRQYTITNISTNATMTVRTRATYDGGTVDAPNAVPSGASVTFTASGNANFLRIISTQAATGWIIEEHGTPLYNLEEDVERLKTDKLDATVYKNETTGTCTSADTFQNFPFAMKQGKTYICTTLGVGNTMSFRTRATEDGTNIDSLNAVAYGSPKTFTASADANFIRVSSYLSNGSFKIQESGTISWEIDALQPVAPIFNLPSTIYAVTGKELNIYFDNICEDSDKYTFDIVCAKGAQMERGYKITPVDADAGTYTMTINAYLDNKIISTAETSLVVSAEDSGDGDSVSFILMGDSTVNGTDTQILADFTDDVMAVTSKGTRGTTPASHEGRTGWTFQYYYNSAEIGGITNPFRNPTSGVFDASYYFTNSGVTAPDWFFIQLGINDMFLKTDDEAVFSQIKTCITQCDAMIASLKSAVSGIKIGIAVTIPPNRSQDAFGKAYGCGQTRSRYKRNNMLFVKSIIDTYDERETDGIYLVPIFTNLDTTYNMGLESMPVNARNTAITYESPIANGGVHPVESGYKQLADVYMAFLKAQA